MRIVAFDMGIRNFAFASVDLPDTSRQYHWGDVRHVHVHDLSGGNIYRNLIGFLDRYRSLWEVTDVVLIEQQLNRMNIQATKLSCHVYSYFLNHHPNKFITEYPSVYKTKFTQFPYKSSSHKERKQYAIQYVMEHYRESDPVLYDWIDMYRKKDDICDCILMCNTFLQTPLGKMWKEDRDASSPS